MACATKYFTSSKSNEIPAEFQTGIIALKWPEDIRRSSTFHVVQLSIDSKGYYLICGDKSANEFECFDLALIHDTRAEPPPGFSGDDCFNNITFGALDVPHHLKWLSIYYGDSYVATNELRVIGFYLRTPGLVREWAEKLFQFGHNPIIRNLSNLQCLEKLHSRIINGLIEFTHRRILVQKLIQFLCKNNHDAVKEAKISEALKYVKLPCRNSLLIDTNEFTFERFFHFYMKLMDRQEIKRLFESLGGKFERFLDWKNMKTFLQIQNDSIEPDYYEEKAKAIIEKYEHEMSEESFLRYLLSHDNFIVDTKIFDLHMDMSKPLAHYFIASSHNTYLVGSQLTGKASVEMYRQVLLTGCRCIELDVVDSDKKDDEPEIKHIRTPVRPILFRDVIHAIKEYAFKVTPYPLTLSIENHSNPKVQIKMAKYLVDILGDYLLKEPLKSHPCEPNIPLPSPNDLLYKILIKNKKLQSKSNSNRKNSPHGLSMAVATSSHSSGQGTDNSNEAFGTTPSNITADDLFKRLSTSVSQPLENPRFGIMFEDECFSDEDKVVQMEIPTKVPETKPTDAMSNLVIYLIPTQYKSFVLAEERRHYHEMTSLSEERGQNIIREYPKEYLAFNKRQISRIYPRGTRFESSNYNPYIFWRIGCQMVALNYQTLDIPMQLNLGLFSLNNYSGYIEKPSILCQCQTKFDPRVLKHLENVISYQIDMKVFSGQFLCQDREPTFVDIQIYGMYGEETKRLEYRLRAKRWNGFRAIYDENETTHGELPISFPRVILPEMAAIRISVTAEDGSFVGQCFLPVTHLRSGYRHIVLRNQINIPINSSSLFVFIRRTIFINPKDQEFVEKLVQPIFDQCTNSFNYHDDLSSNLLLRIHKSSTNDIQENVHQRNSSDCLDDTNTYQKHVIASSRLNNQKTLCKILSLNDIHPKEIFKRDQMIQNKLRRISMDFQGGIQKEENRFQLNLNQLMIKNHLTTSAIQITENLEEISDCLIQLYLNKFKLQKNLECKQINEYYKSLEKEITGDFDRKLIQLTNILKKEKARLNEYVREQGKKEANQTSKNEKNREKVLLNKQRSFEKHAKIGELTSQILDNLFEQAQETLQNNLQINLIQLDEERTKEFELCSRKYADGLDRIRMQIKEQIYPNECVQLNSQTTSSTYNKTAFMNSSEMVTVNRF